MLPRPGMWMRLDSTDGKGAGSSTGAFEPRGSLLCGSIRPRFSHVAAACPQKKIQCVSSHVRWTDSRSTVVVPRSESRSTGAGLLMSCTRRCSLRPAYSIKRIEPRHPAHDPHNPECYTRSHHDWRSLDDARSGPDDCCSDTSASDTRLVAPLGADD